MKSYTYGQLVDAFTEYYQMFKDDPDAFDASYEDEPAEAAKNVMDFVVKIMESY